MAPRRVFISSVMRGFEAERAAARAAVVSLRQEPVMAEDFGAKPYSPEVACLEGVRASDIYVGLFGSRYGSLTPSERSVTGEEFLEARRLGLPILCFEQQGTKESEQEAFLKRVKDYSEGYVVESFRTPEELTPKVVQALYDHIAQPGVATLDSSGAAARLERHQWGSRRPPNYGTWFGVVLFPARQGESYLPPTDLGLKELQDQLLQPALFGPAKLFRLEHGIAPEEGDEYITFRQPPDAHAASAILEVHSDGTLVYGKAIDTNRTRDHSLVRLYVIDEDEVLTALTAFTAYAHQFYAQLPRGPVISSLYLGMSITGIQHKQFGRHPAADPSGMSIPMHQLEDPLRVPRQPLQAARAELADAPKLGQRATELIARTFRLAKAYYSG